MKEIIRSILGNRSFEEVLPPDVGIEEVKKEASKLIRERIAEGSRMDPPVFINISGLPASGKTMLAKKILQDNPCLLYISFDEIMESLIYYQKDFLQDKERAFERWELPARFIGYKFLSQSLKERLSILFEHSNAIPQHIDLYKKILSLGYNVEIRFVDATPDLVVGRLTKRGRFFDEKMVYERGESMQKLIPEYKRILADKFITLEPWKE